MPASTNPCRQRDGARWALRTYEHYKRKAGEICDVVCYDKEDREVAFFVLILQEDGSFVPQSNRIHLSGAGRHTLRYLDQHYDAVHETIMALANLIIKGIYQPQVSVVPECLREKWCRIMLTKDDSGAGPSEQQVYVALRTVDADTSNKKRK